MSAEELKKNLEELTKKYEEAMEQLKALKESAPVSSSLSPATSSTVGQKQIVVFPRDKKIKNFTGRKTEGDQPVEDFIDELKITFEARDMTSAERVDFIMLIWRGQPKKKCECTARKREVTQTFSWKFLRKHLVRNIQAPNS